MLVFPTTFPAPIIPAADSVPALRWGIMAPGGIAATFAEAVHAHTEQKLVAVASRSLDRAQDFANTWGIEKAYGDYAELLANPDVDVIYIAAQQHVHRDLALQSIAAGKHILVEKPFAMTGAEARDIVAAARAAGVFAMEAMWTRYLPQTSIINQLVADGTLGDIHLVTADHGQHIPEGHRVRSLDSGGGALLDLGIYPIAFASQILGAPTAVHNVGSLIESGVDAQSLLTLSYAGAAQAQLNTTLLARTPITASVAGTDALLEVGNGFFTPTSLTLSKPGFDGESIHWKDETGVVGHRGLSYQATALAGFVAQGRTESPVHSLDETVAILDTIDSARWQLGYRFQSEQ
ncbi:Gfo/Idh/MocA family oxidoreductase [Salinibacterium sp. NSLL150]|uniref:Gfo/Idh/MocA family protein n=1 Tax=unclassified Salinibacterium TaxID=2632331 RepID=UPI0018CE2BB6|nr:MULTISPECIES: Gfo/Idh/MocA family oxidoreductase [unclassified Salinibacterium]MBH0099425.1 Gfo/Idh/MocA family oxidoreductase [Salinibacterium sp. NSLL35]MBH0102179.1 Gfo/Idh/MocA family oxidoreductase [Salinibacterium sp. NSLL150]MBH0104939.1 Gfo/Idh/MocA family oxidoreductase [Salinibacterium sp. NSLL16]MBH0107699.1 Gfo/Idh/MocA family oxidoreductase [Salinibacterium sp. NSLL17]